ncbi:MAG: tetratricopeptide repeat protein [Terracidiphilus sp.]|jgi:tetratricopeptide (TPR) repeat protein
MRRSFAPFALLWLVVVAQSIAQTVAKQDTPESLTATYNQAMLAKQWPQAVAAAQQLVGLKATSLNLRYLGNAQLYSGLSDEALATYGQAIAAAEKEKPAEGKPLKEWNDGLSQIYVGKGNALLKLKRTSEAIETYNQAAGLAINAGKAYFNVCAVYYNNGNTKDSAAACRKSVQADPTMANAWFVLASDLFADAPIADSKVTATPEMREALEKYLALAPQGPHAVDVKEMLEMLTK